MFVDRQEGILYYFLRTSSFVELKRYRFLMLSSGNAFVWNLVHGVGLCYIKDIADMGAVVVVHSNNLSLYRVHAHVKFQLCFIFQVAPPHKDLVISSTHEMNTKNKTTEV